MLKIVMIDGNDWFRELAAEALLDYGIETVGSARRPEQVREFILRYAPEVLTWTARLDDQEGESAARLLAGLPVALVPGVVVLGDNLAPRLAGKLGLCPSAGKSEGVGKLASQIRAAAESRARLEAVLSGRVQGEAALDILEEALGLGDAVQGADRVRRALELCRQEGAVPAGLYRQIALERGESASAAERDIRLTLEEAWRRAGISCRIAAFGRDWEALPENEAFFGAVTGLLAGDG